MIINIMAATGWLSADKNNRQQNQKSSSCLRAPETGYYLSNSHNWYLFCVAFTWISCKKWNEIWIYEFPIYHSNIALFKNFQWYKVIASSIDIEIILVFADGGRCFEIWAVTRSGIRFHVVIVTVIVAFCQKAAIYTPISAKEKVVSEFNTKTTVILSTMKPKSK